MTSVDKFQTSFRRSASRVSDLRHLLAAVRDEAIRHQSSVATPSHLLLALVRDPRTPASRMLTQVGVDCDYLSRLLKETITIQSRGDISPFGVVLDTDCNRIFQRAFQMLAGDRINEPNQIYLHCLAALECEWSDSTPIIATILLHELLERARQSSKVASDSHSDSIEKNLSTSGA